MHEPYTDDHGYTWHHVCDCSGKTEARKILHGRGLLVETSLEGFTLWPKDNPPSEDNLIHARVRGGRLETTDILPTKRPHGGRRKKHAVIIDHGLAVRFAMWSRGSGLTRDKDVRAAVINAMETLIERG